MDGTTEAVRIANRIHAKHGTTTIFPTTTTGTPDQLDRMLNACLSFRRVTKSTMELVSEGCIITDRSSQPIKSDATQSMDAGILIQKNTFDV
jgi:N-acetylglucosamine-6-phosphate deacetylase